MAHIYNDREREAQRRMMEGKMQRIQMELDRARVAAATGRAQEVERVIRNVRSQLNDVTLPLDFQKQIQDQSKKLELDAYVKAVDMTLDEVARWVFSALVSELLRDVVGRTDGGGDRQLVLRTRVRVLLRGLGAA